MAEPHSDPHLYVECLAAMAVAGDAYPCDTLAPLGPTDCALPDREPAIVAANRSTSTRPRRTERP